MADKEIKYVNQAIKDEHDNSSSPFTKRALLYGWDADNLQKVRMSLESDGSLGESLPTTGNNPSLALSYTGDNLTKITKTISGTDYEKTLSYTGSTLDSVSGWSAV